MDIDKLFSMKKPCKECPFRKDGTMYKSLHPDRMDEIIQSLHNDAPFHCHKTIDYDQDEHLDQVDDAVYCAGALGYMVKAKDSNLPMRLGMVLGLFDPNQLQDLDDLIDPEEE